MNFLVGTCVLDSVNGFSFSIDAEKVITGDSRFLGDENRVVLTSLKELRGSFNTLSDAQIEFPIWAD